MLNFILFCCIVLFVVAICFWFRARNHGLWRQILYKTHLWLGIVSGIVLFIVCLTGTLLVFRWEIEDLFEHKYVISHPDMSLLSLEDLVTNVEQNMNGKAVLVAPPDLRGDPVGLYMENNEKKFNVYLLDPYTGEILTDTFENWSTLQNFFHFVYILHTSLFLPSPIGGIVVGSVTLIFVIVALSGLCLWLPANFRNIKAWANSFFVRFRKGKSQLIFDLHKTLGFYVLIPVLLMALTGLVWSFQWYSNGVATIFDAPNPHSYNEVKSSPPTPDAKRLPIDFFDKKADELFAQHKGINRGIYLPSREDDPVMMMGWYPRRWNARWGFDRIQFDQYTGEVLQFDQFDKFSIGRKIVMMQPFLHYGSFGGLPMQIIYFIACLIATTLPFTGVMIWWRKLRNLRKAKNKTDDNNLPDAA
jgi:uncharacterized iron-regulated membrane protein